MTRPSCPHVHGMAPVNAGDILHLFRYMADRPTLYRLADWPQLFMRCWLCSDLALLTPEAYETIEWPQALEWAEAHND